MKAVDADGKVATRVTLAILTCLLVVLGSVVVHRGHFLGVVISLVVIVLLAADDCRHARRSFEGFEEQVSTTIQALPWAVYNALAPSLERVTSVIRGDAGTSAEATTTDLTADLYAGAADQALHGADGSVDPDKFASMKLDYKQIAVFLCRMKSIAPEAHDAILTAMGGTS